jgi:hypothetical protein
MWGLERALYSFSQVILFETRQMLIPCYILKIRTEFESYQFGLNGNKFWHGNLPFAVVRK